MALLPVIALIAGCGGSAYTKRDFIARADAICAGALRETRSIPAGPDLASYAAAVLPVIQSEANQLRSLRRPPDNGRNQARLNEYFAALAKTVRDYHTLAAAARRGDQETVAAAEASLAASPLESLATSYGLRSCGAPSATVA